jgi:hypothetical protein
MTTRAEFIAFVEKALEDVIQFAEQYTGKPLSRAFSFRWLSQDKPIDEGIVEAIVGRVYVDEDHIYPCVDIGVGDLSQDGTPIIVANVAGYSPCPFQKNWTGRDGPFVFIIGQPFLDKLAGKPRIDASRSFGFLIPDMKNLKK